MKKMHRKVTADATAAEIGIPLIDTTSSQTIAKPNVIRWLGECIFPQPIIASAEKFGEDAIIACINDGLIVKSQSKIGSNPTMMCKPKGYMELSDKGWELYKKLTREAIV